MSSSSKTNKDLLHRLMILEKFIELKSNECAYYRSKVHLMQINPMSKPISIVPDEQPGKPSIPSESQDDSTENSTSIDDQERKTPPIPSKPILKATKEFHNSSKKIKSPFLSSSLRRYRRNSIRDSNYALNQNYADDVPTSQDPTHLLEQILHSYAKKHLQQSSALVSLCRRVSFSS